MKKLIYTTLENNIKYLTNIIVDNYGTCSPSNV